MDTLKITKRNHQRMNNETLGDENSLQRFTLCHAQSEWYPWYKNRLVCFGICLRVKFALNENSRVYESMTSYVGH